MVKLASTDWSTDGLGSGTPSQPRHGLYHQLVDTIDRTMLSDAISILELSEASGMLEFVVATARARNLLSGSTVRWGQGIAGQCAERARPIICNDVRHSSGFLDLADRLFHFRTQSVLCSPIVREGAVVGVLETVNRLDADGFGSVQLQALSTLTRRMAGCWDDDPAASRALFDAAVLQCRQLMSVAGISLLATSELGSQLTFRHSITTIDTGLVGCRLGRGQGLAGWACQHSQPVLVEDVQSDTRFFRGVDAVSSFTSRSIIAVPFTHCGQVAGVLELINSHLSEPFGISELATAQELVRRLEGDLELLDGA
jgi:GAF domain-containing protein